MATIPRPRQSEHVFVGGTTGSGKSYASKRLFDSIDNSTLAIYIDYSYDFATNTIRDVSYIPQAIKLRRKIIFQSDEHDAIEKLIDWIFYVYRRYKMPPLVLFCDEVADDTYQDLVIPLCRRARHLNISVVVITQRIQNVSKSISNLCRAGKVFFDVDNLDYNSIRNNYRLSISYDDKCRFECMTRNAECEHKPVCDAWYLRSNRYSAIHYDGRAARRLPP